MLKKRIITASILFPIIFLVILYGSTALVNTVSAVILIIAALEWNKLIGIWQCWLNFLIISLMITGCVFYRYFHLSVFICCLFATLWWVISLFAVIMYPKGQKLWSNKWLGFGLGWILFIPTWLSLDWLHAANNFGPRWVIFLCFLVWGADLGGYVIGKLWGNKKLLEQVSPGKTWVGVFGAFLFTFIVVVSFANSWLCDREFMKLLILSIIVVTFSILGDLTESLFKRIRGVKDSGNLLPGHGGVLDRIDGLLAAVPVFIISVNFL